MSKELKELGVETTATEAEAFLRKAGEPLKQLKATREEQKKQAVKDVKNIIGCSLVDIPTDFGKFVSQALPKINTKKCTKELSKDEQSFSIGRYSYYSYSGCRTAVVKDRIGAQGYSSKAKYFDGRSTFKGLRQAHVDLVTDAEKRQLLQELFTFKTRYEKVTEQQVEVKLETPIVLKCIKTVNFSLPGYNNVDLIDGYEEKTLTKLKIKVTSNNIRITGDGDFEMRIQGSDCSLSHDNGKIVLGIDQIVPAIEDDIKKAFGSFELAYKTWDYLKEKYAYFLFLTGNF